MAGKDSTAVDDEPQRRESPVRHAHAVEANRHGRASTPGYLGLPLDDQAASEREALEAGASDESQRAEDADGPGRNQQSERESPKAQASSDSDGAQETERNPRTRAPRARPKTGGQAKAGQTKARTSKAKARPARQKAPAGSSGQKGQPRRKQASAKSANGSGTRATGQRGAKAQAKPKKSTRRGHGGRGAAARSSIISRAVSVADEIDDGLAKRATGTAVKMSGKVARRAALAGLRATARAARRGLQQVGAAGTDALIERTHRLPIQQSLDVAVPLEVAWEQWMEFAYFPDGVHRVADVERDGDSLSGHLDGVGQREWRAEILDERENESFAWRSREGTDNAGLVTFHPLSDRLTRIELNLDVQPTDLLDAAGLTLRIADRRVEAELRRFKARAELLSPDVYDELLDHSRNGGG
jgi:uncharacterized membrane protein